MVTFPVPSPTDLHEEIRRRAQEIYEQRGRIQGHPEEDWLQAEAEIRAKYPHPEPARIVLKVKGVTYTGEYDPATANGYHPGEFSRGDAIKVRVENDRMFLRRANGSELEIRVLSKKP